MFRNFNFMFFIYKYHKIIILGCILFCSILSIYMADTPKPSVTITNDFDKIPKDVKDAMVLNNFKIIYSTASRYDLFKCLAFYITEYGNPYFVFYDDNNLPIVIHACLTIANYFSDYLKDSLFNPDNLFNWFNLERDPENNVPFYPEGYTFDLIKLFAEYTAKGAFYAFPVIIIGIASIYYNVQNPRELYQLLLLEFDNVNNHDLAVDCMTKFIHIYYDVYLITDTTIPC